jgi:hypothetical protein
VGEGVCVCGWVASNGNATNTWLLILMEEYCRVIVVELFVCTLGEGGWIMLHSGGYITLTPSLLEIKFVKKKKVLFDRFNT